MRYSGQSRHVGKAVSSSAATFAGVSALAVLLMGAPNAWSAGAIAPTASAAASVVNKCWSDDNGYPVLDDVTVSPATVEFGQSVTVTASAHDVGGPGMATGVAAVKVLIDGYYRVYGLHRNTDGTFSAVIPYPSFPNDVRTNRVTQVEVIDRGGLHHTYSSDELASQGLDASFEVVPATPETVPPAISDVKVPARVDARHGGRVTVTARIQDGDSGVWGVWVDMFRGRWFADAFKRMTLVPGTTDTYRGSLRVGRWDRKAITTMRVKYVEAEDRAGNVTKLKVDEPVLVRRHADASYPKLVGPPYEWIKGHPGTLDLRDHGRTVTVMARYTDSGSGVRQVDLMAHLGGRAGHWLPQHGPAHLVQGNRHRGTWAQKFKARPCLAPGNGRLRLGLNHVEDAANGLGGDDIIEDLDPGAKVLAHDHAPPGIFSIQSTSKSITIRFTEPVRGASGASAAVTDPNGNPIPGTWTCKTAGDLVNCARGPLRTAIFTSDTPGDGTSTAVFRFNPDRHIDLVDLHGNPFRGHDEFKVIY